MELEESLLVEAAHEGGPFRSVPVAVEVVQLALHPLASS